LSKKILVTGGTGFLGAYTIKELVEKGYAVRAIRRSPKLPFFIEPAVWERVEWVEGDILDVVSLDAAMNGIDNVIHSAALVSFGKGDRNKIYQLNRDGTANVVNMALEKQIGRLVHISSVAALGRTAAGDHVNEEKKWVENRINTHYARSKHLAEMEVWRGMAEGLNAVIVNPSTILGYGDWHQGSCALFKKMYDGFRWYTNGINGFVDVEDAAKVIVLLMESEITEERYIINAENRSFRQLLTQIAEGLNKKPPSTEANPVLSGLAWRLDGLRSLLKGTRPVLTKESAKIALSKTYFENDKLLRALPGFRFRPIEETVKNACKKYLQAINQGRL